MIMIVIMMNDYADYDDYDNDYDYDWKKDYCVGKTDWNYDRNGF